MPHSVRRDVEITNEIGLHLRAAYRVVELAKQFRSEIWVFCNGQSANGKSILDLMTLAAQHGSRVQIEARGADAEEAAQALHDLIEARFLESPEAEPTVQKSETPRAIA